MPMPPATNIELPLMRLIADAGGQLTLAESVEGVAKYFPEMTPMDLASKLDSGGNRWTNRVQWTRQNLTKKGQLASGGHGVWAITAKGDERLKREWDGWKPKYSGLPDDPSGTGVMLHHPAGGKATGDEHGANPREEIEDACHRLNESVRDALLDRIQQVSPALFESLIKDLLEKMGFSNVEVKGRSGDGGIDGVGSFDKLGMMRIAFQAKKWAVGHNVGSPTVTEFVGAMKKHRAECGVFVTTSTFTKDAWDVPRSVGSLRLVDGERLAVLMVEYGLGIQKRQLDLPSVDGDYFEGLA